MDREELIDNLGTIARSGTKTFVARLAEAKDGAGLIGQFGVGFYSAFMVADRIVVHSRAAGSDEIWTWSSSGGAGFEIVPASEEDARRITRGSEIVLHLKHDAKKYLETYEIERLVGVYSDNIQFPIELVTEASEPRQINSASALWQRPKSELTVNDYEQVYREIASASDEPAMTLHYRAEGRYSYAVLLFVPSTRPYDLFGPAGKGKVKLYVRRVFITDDADLLPTYLRFIRGVIDSEDLPLNISREMLQNNPQLAQIRKAVTSRVISELEQLGEKEPENFSKIWDAFGAIIKEGLYEDFERREKLLALSRFATTAGEKRTLRQYIADLKPKQTEVYFLVGDNIDRLKSSPRLEAATARGIEVLLLTDPIDAFWSDVSPTFLASARRQFAGEKSILTTLYDLDRAPNSQPLPVASVDVIVATNVLHAAKDIRAVLRNLRQLAGSGGHLLFVETVRRHRVADCTGGLLDGWWAFRDRDLRPDYPLLTVSQWQQVLLEEGFQTSVIPVSEGMGGGEAHVALVMAIASGPAKDNQLDIQIDGAHRSAARVPSDLPARRSSSRLVDVAAEFVERRLDALGILTIDRNQKFGDLGVDSMVMVELGNAIKEELAVTVRQGVFFQYDTINLLAEYLSQEHGPALERAQSATEHLVDKYIPVAADAEDYELACPQRGLWFLNQLLPGSHLYNVQGTLDLAGDLDVAALGQALDQVILEQESLRTYFMSDGGLPRQKVEQVCHLKVTYHDLSNLTDDERSERISSLRRLEGGTPFELGRAPLMRAMVLKVGEGDHLFVSTFHHIVIDGWSLRVLLRDLGAHYQRVVLGDPKQTRKLPIQYKDFAEWQSAAIRNGLWASQERYWLDQLAGELPVLEMPADRPRPRVQTYEGRIAEANFEAGLAWGISELSRRLGLTTFMVMLGGLFGALARLSGQRDIIIGTPAAGRTRPEFEPIIGNFVNLLPLRMNVSDNPTVEELLRRVKDVVLAGFEHQEFPFVQMVDAVGLQGELSGNPIFRTALVVQNPRLEQDAQFSFGSVIAKVREGEDLRVAKMDLVFYVIQDAKGFTVRLEYNSDIFSHDAAVRINEQFRKALKYFVDTPGGRVLDYPLLSEAERHRILVEWNDTAADYPRDKCLHELFAEQAAKTPDAVALVYEDSAVSYGELDRRSNQLAHHLRKLGVGPEVVVGLCVERSLEMVVGLLGILKAGGAYLPLDPEYPRERLSYMMSDTRVPVVVTQSHVCERLAAEEGVQFLLLDRDWPQIAAQSDSVPESGAGPDNLAYVIYTSGSTGKPKGVEVTQRNVVRLVRGQRYFKASRQDTLLQLAPLAFDASTFELWMTLANGAKLVIYQGSRLDIAQLKDVIAGEGVSALWLTAGLFDEIVDQDITVLSPLRCLLAGGDVLSAARIRKAMRRLSGCQLINGYGPTEATTFSSYFAVSDLDDFGTSVPIGRPISNAQLYVLNGELEAVPIGVVGELYIGGVGLARGYAGQPGLTADRFVPSPFVAGERLYRTGDLARWGGDGNLDFLGRADHQVKVRGFRIELAEVEAALLRQAGVSQAIVVAREDEGGSKRLVAYMVPSATDESYTNIPLTTDVDTFVQGVRSGLLARLPDHMVPSNFVVLPRLPLTPNGKVNRAALPTPDHDLMRGAYVAPRDGTEEILAGLFADVLGLERVGIEDNFFDLGGHSLLATRLVSRIRQDMSLEMPLKLLFEVSSVRKLAQRIQQLSVSIAPPLVPLARTGAVALSFSQERLWFLNQLGLAGPAYNMSVGVRLVGRLDVPVLNAVLSEVVRRHEAIRTRFETREGIGYQVIDPPWAINIEAHEITAEAAGDSIRAVVNLPFDLARDRLLRIELFRVGEQDHVLAIVMHHIVSDGWSLGVLTKEVEILYKAYGEGRASPLSPLAVQYADYAVWQRGWLTGDVLEKQVKYWKDRLRNSPAALDLPTDHVRPAVQSYRGEGFTIGLPAELTASLNDLARSEGATLFMVLLAAFKVVLSRWSGQSDVVVGSPIAGRTHREVEGLIGFFVNALALRTDLSGDLGFRELVRRVKETALGAYAHQDLPFEKLVAELQPVRDLSRQPIFQVLFALQNVPQEGLQLPGLELRRTGGGRPTAKYDLALYVSEVGGGLQAYFEYATDLFDGSTIERLAGHWAALLEAAVAQPDVALSELSMVGVSERADRRLRELDIASLGSERAVCIAHSPSITDCFLAQVRSRPEALALVAGEHCWSYGRLDREAGRIAALLVKERGSSHEAVGLLLPHVPMMVAAILGVLGSGKFYVPLSAEDPPARLRAILAESGCGCVLSSAELRGLGAELGAALLVVDDAPVAAVELRSRPSGAIAYVLYTSGTTGTPKGVAQCDRHILQHAAVYSGALGLAGSDRMTLLAGYGTDAAAKNIFGSLLSGAALCMWDVRSTGIEGLQEWLVEHEVTIWHSTPSLLRAALPQFAARANLRWAVLGGEGAKAEDIAIVQRHGGENCRLLTALSQTECSTASHYAPDFARDLGSHRLPVGRPVPGAQIVLLDDADDPADVRGEVAIGGGGIALGYWRRPGLTAERFVPSPYGDGERLYRSGDLARWRADGELEYLGRLDQQVKIRGYRVEPGEIEAALLEQASVHQAVVLAREDVAGEKHLVAYVVAADAAAVEAIQLRDHLKRSLPEYMVPSAFVLLEALPLTANRKIDRRALPAPEEDAVIRGAYVAPRTPTEELLAGIWCELLKLDRVGVNDNFFELGGHSLLAMRVVAFVREALAVELPLRTLFEAPSVDELAKRVEAAQRAASIVKGTLEEIIGDLTDMSEEEVEKILNSLVGADP
jgi:amino acid adenylation domain-containing protein